MEIDLKKIKETVTKKHFYIRSFVLICSVFLLALNYNLFLVPNNFVIGGLSGLAIITKELFSIEPSLLILVLSIILLFFDYLFLGLSETLKSIIGSIMYPLFISATVPLANFLIPYLQFDNMLIVVLIAGLIYGISYGLIYKTGFNTGGSDILIKIVNKYAKVQESKAVLIVDLSIMLLGAIIFGANKFVYSTIILVLGTIIMDRILIGISNSKLFFIHTKEDKKVKEFIINELKMGVTILNAKGGFTEEKNYVLMCVVPTKDYYMFKETVLQIDPNAFFVINDCYEVNGGVKGKRSNLPFI